MAKRKIELDDRTEVALTIVELSPWRDRLARSLLALIGLRHVLFISAKNPIQYVKIESKSKRKPKKAV